MKAIFVLLFLSFVTLFPMPSNAQTIDFKCEQDGYFETIIGTHRKAVTCQQGKATELFDEQIPMANS